MATINYLCKGALLLFILHLCSCTQYNYIDGGQANGVHDCSMWDYFKKQPRDWDSVMLMIDHAGMRDIFEGKGEYKQITFFGLTNYSIRRSMMDHNKNLDKNDPDYWNSISDIPVGKCRDILQRLVIPQRLMLVNIPRGFRLRKLQEGVSTWQKVDGITLKAMRGSLFIWTQREDYHEVPNTGEISLWIASDNQKNTSNQRIASTDIQTNNGVVMAMNNDYRFINI